MSNNEEPIAATEPAGTDDELQILDLDDVEGHGLKEVAAGLGAAAVLAGGGTALAASVGMHPSLPHMTSPTPSISNPVTTTDRVTDNSINAVRDTRDGAAAAAISDANAATALAGHEVTAAGNTADAVLSGTGHAAAQVLDATGNAVRADLKTAGQVVSGADATAVTVARGSVTTANTVVSATGHTATTTVNDTSRKVATVIQLTTSTVNALETTIIATVDNLNPDAGAGASGMGSTGWVTFSLGGQNIASVQLHNGQATVTVKTTSLPGKVLQAVYSGDTVHASSLRSITL